jgi:hypothetical protein
MPDSKISGLPAAGSLSDTHELPVNEAGTNKKVTGAQIKNHTHTKSQITDFTHAHVKADITDFTHTHVASSVTDFQETTEDIVATMIVAGVNLTGTYADGPGTLTLDVDSHTHTASQVTDFSEATDDRVSALLTAGTNVSLVYNDPANTLTINATAGAAQTGFYNVLDYGAVLNGTTDDRTALANADAAANAVDGTVLIPRGEARVTSNLTMTAKVHFSGGEIKPSSGVTVTLSGPVSGEGQIFDRSLGGKIALTGAGAVNVNAAWFASSSGSLLHALDATTDVGGVFFASPVIDAPLTQGTNSIKATLSAGPAAAFYVNLASNQAILDHVHVGLDYRTDLDGPGWGDPRISDIFKIYAADGVGLTGNTVSAVLSNAGPMTLCTATLDVSSLTAGVRSVGIKGYADLPGTERKIFWIDNLRFMGAGGHAVAESSGATSIIIPKNYTQPADTPDVNAGAGVTLFDTRTGAADLTGFRRVRSATGIVNDGTVDETQAITDFLNSGLKGEQLQLSGVFLANRTILLQQVQDVQFDFRNARFIRTVPKGGSDPGMATIEISRGCRYLTFYGGTMNHYRLYSNNGSAALEGVGTTINGTTMEMNADEERCRIQATDDDDPGSGMFAEYVLPAFPSDVQTKILTLDPTFARGAVFELTLSDTNQVASDCFIYVRQEKTFDYTLTPLTLTTAIDASTTTVPTTDAWRFDTGSVIEVDGEHILLGDVAGGGTNDITACVRGYNGTTAVSHAVGAVCYGVLESRTLTLTASATPYVIVVNALDRLQKYTIWVRKKTATANTIKLHSYRMWGSSHYSSTEGEGQDGYFVSGDGDYAFYNPRMEGIGGDSMNGGAGIHNVRIFDLDAIVIGRQGISWNNGNTLLIQGGRIANCGRSGVDLEPYAQDWSCTNVTLNNLHVYNVQNAGFGMNDNVVNLTINSCSVHRHNQSYCLNLNGRNVRVTDFYVEGSGGSAVKVSGQDVHLHGCVADGPLWILSSAQGSVTDYFFTAGYNIIETGAGVALHNVVGPSVPTTRLALETSNGDGGQESSPSRLDTFGHIENFYRRHYPRTHTGHAISGDIRGPRAGLGFSGSRLVDFGGLTGYPTTGTLLSSASRSSSGSSAVVDLGAAAANVQTRGRMRVRIDASVVGAGVTLSALKLMTSHDNVNFWQTENNGETISGAATHAHGVSWLLECAVKRYARLDYTIAGGSVTFQSTYEFWPTGNNFVLPVQTIASAATTHAVTFPSFRLPLHSGNDAVAIAGGSLGAATYYYRLGVGTWEREPSQWSSETSAVVDGATTTAVRVTMGNNFRKWLEEGCHIDRLTILRGTSAGTYTKRYDIYSIRDFSGYRYSTISVDDLGTTVAFPSPANWVTPSGATIETVSHTAVDMSGWEPDAEYSVHAGTPNWDSGAIWVTNKTRSGHTLNWANAAPGANAGRVPVMVTR